MALFRYPKRKLRKLIQQGEYEEAIALGNSLASKFANDTDYLFIMGSIYYIVEDANKALHYFDRVLAVKPDDVETLYLKTRIHISREEHDTASECCRQILKQNPKHTEARHILESLEDD